MKRIDAEKNTHYKVAVFGESGTGKTTLGTSAPKPLFLLSERQGLNSIREACARSGEPVPPVLFMESMADYGDVLRSIRVPTDGPLVIRDKAGNELESFDEWPETIVIDSLTDAMDKIKRELLLQSPPKVQDDGLAEMTMRHWGALRDRCEKLVRAFRDVPFHVLFLALRKVKDGDANTSRFTGADLPMNALPGVLQACVNVAGMLRRDAVPKLDESGQPMVKDGRPLRDYRHSVQMRGPEHLVVKAPLVLDTYEVPDLGVWFEKLDGAVKNTETMKRLKSETSTNSSSHRDQITDRQMNAIMAIGRKLGWSSQRLLDAIEEEFEVKPSDMTRPQAYDCVGFLQRKLLDGSESTDNSSSSEIPRKATERQINGIHAIGRSLGLSTQDLQKQAREHAGADIEVMTRAQASEFIGKLQKMLVSGGTTPSEREIPEGDRATERQRALIKNLFSKLGWSDEVFRQHLLDCFGVEETTGLTRSDATALIAELKKNVDSIK